MQRSEGTKHNRENVRILMIGMLYTHSIHVASGLWWASSQSVVSRFTTYVLLRSRSRVEKTSRRYYNLILSMRSSLVIIVIILYLDTLSGHVSDK
jgi:hypothetical protein